MADRCRGCDRKVIWGKTEAGKTIPLDAVAPVYVKMGDGTYMRHLEAYVLHFSTCPKANDFSGSKKQEATNVQ